MKLMVWRAFEQRVFRRWPGQTDHVRRKFAYWRGLSTGFCRAITASSRF